MFLHLLGNFAVIGFFVAVWTNLQDWSLNHSRLRASVALGLLMGCGAVAAMLFSFQLNDGIFFDLRAVAIALAGMFGGPVAGLIAAALAGAYRAMLGGAGMIGGLTGIAIAMGVGIFGHELTRIWHRKKTILYLTADLVSVGPMLGLFSLPHEARKLILPIELGSLSSVSFVAFLVAAYAITRNEKLARTRSLLIAAVKQAPEYFYVKDVNCAFVAANRNVAYVNGLDNPDEMIGKSDLDLAKGPRAQDLLNEERRILQSGRAVADRIENIRNADGQLRTYATSKSIVLLGNGQVAGLVGVTKDITAMVAR